MRLRAVIRINAGNTSQEVRQVLLILIDAVRRLRHHDRRVQLRIEHDHPDQPAGQHWKTRTPDRED